MIDLMVRLSLDPLLGSGRLRPDAKPGGRLHCGNLVPVVSVRASSRLRPFTQASRSTSTERPVPDPTRSHIHCTQWGGNNDKSLDETERDI